MARVVDVAAVLAGIDAALAGHERAVEDLLNDPWTWIHGDVRLIGERQ